MEAALAGLERSPVVAALRTSFFVYPVLSALHILAVGAVLTTVLLMDLRVIGVLRGPAGPQFTPLLRRTAFAGFALAVLTGAMLFSVRASEYAAMPLFLGKLGLIGLAALNFAVFTVVDGGLRRLLAAVSIVLWFAALLAGRFLGFVQ